MLGIVRADGSLDSAWLGTHRRLQQLVGSDLSLTKSNRCSANRHLRTVQSYNFSVLNSRMCNFSGDEFLVFVQNVATKWPF